MRRSKKYILPVLVVAALAVIGAASTNAISFTGGTAQYADVGYGAVTTNSSVAISNVHYTVANAGQTVTAVTVTFGTALLTTDDVNIAFNEDGQTGGTTTQCTDQGSETVYVCNDGGTGFDQSVAGLTDVDLSVVPST